MEVSSTSVPWEELSTSEDPNKPEEPSSSSQELIDEQRRM